MFCGDVKFHFTFIDELFRLVFLLHADLINFLNKRISNTVPESKNKINNSLFKRRASRVDVVKSADFNDQLQGALSDFSIFVKTPLACKLCELLVVLS